MPDVRRCREHEPLRVLHVVRSLEMGGLERVVCELVAARGFEDSRVVCLTARGEFAEPLMDRGGYVYDLSASSRSRRELFSGLVSVMRSYQPDVVHCHNMFAHAMGVLASIRAGRRPTLMTKHGTYLPRGVIRNVFHKWLVQQSHVVAVSREIQQVMREWAPFLGERLSYIPNGIMLPDGDRKGMRTSVRAAMGWKNDEWIVMSVSRIVAGKRLDLLLSAFERFSDSVPKSRLVIVGDGPALDELRSQAMASQVARRVTFLGKRMDVTELLSGADVFVLSSDNEGLPMAVLEAMAVGLPVVATSVGEVPTVVDDSKTGYLVAPQDPATLADAMSRLALTPKTAREMGSRGRDRITSLFSVEATRAEYEAIYRRIACGEHSSVPLG